MCLCLFVCVCVCECAGVNGFYALFELLLVRDASISVLAPQRPWAEIISSFELMPTTIQSCVQDQCINLESSVHGA